MAEGKDYIIGIDTGGTFTDVVVMSPSGEVWTAKASTTPDEFSRGVMDALTEASRVLDVDRADLLNQAVLFKHGSTVATNALLTRTGVKVGFITTRGFEDTTEIMRAIGRVDGLSEEEIRHATWVTKPEPLVPRERVLGVRERIDYRGEVVVPLSRQDVMDAIRKLVDEEGCEAIAVSLLHAWANAKHEDDVRALAREADPSNKVFWSFGSELAQVAGEYARANTAIINSYLGPTVDRYLGGLQTKLEEGGLEGPFLIMQGNGGVAHRAHATPVSNLQSGPAGGAEVTVTDADQDCSVDYKPYGGVAEGGYGLCGGYPTGKSVLRYMVDAGMELLDRVKQGEYPDGAGMRDGTWGGVVHPDGVPERVVLPEGSLLIDYVAGGGFGDPLERDPALVLRDFGRGWLTPKIGEEVYGVVLARDGRSVDEATRQSLRERIRAERKQLGAPPSGKTSALDPAQAGEYESVLRFHASLDIARRNGQNAIRCTQCGHLYCGPEENYKNYALRRILDPNDYMEDMEGALPSGEPYIGEYHEYGCPGCQVQLQVDLFCPPMGGDPILWDTRIDV